MFPCVSTQMISADVIKSMSAYANMEHLKKTAVQVCLAEVARVAMIAHATVVIFDAFGRKMTLRWWPSHWRQMRSKSCAISSKFWTQTAVAR